MFLIKDLGNEIIVCNCGYGHVEIIMLLILQNKLQGFRNCSWKFYFYILCVIVIVFKIEKDMLIKKIYFT